MSDQHIRDIFKMPGLQLPSNPPIFQWFKRTVQPTALAISIATWPTISMAIPDCGYCSAYENDVECVQSCLRAHDQATGAGSIPNFYDLALEYMESRENNSGVYDPNTNSGTNKILQDLHNRATQSNDAEAQYQYATAHFKGEHGAPVNLPFAFEWFKRAAKQKHLGAMEKLADMLVTGEGGEVDHDSATRLYREAGNRGSLGAIRSLGWLSMTGEYGFPFDLDLAESSLIRAANENDELALFFLSDFYVNIQEPYTNWKEANHWLRKVPGDRKPWAMGALGFIHMQGGYGLKADASEAHRWLSEAAQAGDSDGQFFLSGLLMSGRLRDANGKPGWTDEPGAIQWLATSADQGNPMAVNAMIGMLEQDASHQINMAKAQDLRKFAIDNGIELLR